MYVWTWSFYKEKSYKLAEISIPLLMEIPELPTNMVNQKGVNLRMHAVIIDAFDLNKGKGYSIEKERNNVLNRLPLVV